MTISISCVETIQHEKAIYAIEKTLKCLDVSKVYWFSNIPFPKEVGCEVVNIRIAPFLRGKKFHEAYSYLTLDLMPEIVDTDYNLIVQHDGFALNKAAWNKSFLDYDYIGAEVSVWFHDRKMIGNGGFSLRSKKLYQAIKSIGMKYHFDDLLVEQFEPIFLLQNLKYKPHIRGFAEDYIICVMYRERLKDEYGIKFAPVEIANQFSTGDSFKITDVNEWAKLNKSFGFHGIDIQKLYHSIFYSLLNNE